MLGVKNIDLEYIDGRTKRTIFSNVSFDIHSGEFVSLLGPSGSGKSSLLYIVSLLKTPTAGEIYLDDVMISGAKNKNEIRYENFGFVFQHHFLIPHLTVLENVCEKNVEKQAKDLLERLGLKDLINQKPYKLSGGERQRVAIARAVVKKPRILFADEPTASLDYHTAQEIMKIFSELQENTTVVCATHDYGILPQTARILRIKDGKVVEDETEENE
jgi:ABC-type lipoprotein export system ATPase subunit